MLLKVKFRDDDGLVWKMEVMPFETVGEVRERARVKNHVSADWEVVMATRHIVENPIGREKDDELFLNFLKPRGRVVSLKNVPPEGLIRLYYVRSIIYN